MPAKNAIAVFWRFFTDRMRCRYLANRAHPNGSAAKGEHRFRDETDLMINLP
jgi:hypothetical protein